MSKLQKDESKGIVLGIIGALCIVAGFVLTILGDKIFNNFYEQVDYYYQHGTMDSFGVNVRYFGFGIIALGGILIFTSIYFGVKARKEFSGKLHKQDYQEVDSVITQLAGNKTIFDVFHSQDGTRTFSFYRNKTCILKAGGEVYHGKMEPLTWKEGHPTLWKIALDINGNEMDYEVSKVEGNILIKGDHTEKVFYRE
ncbi:MAG: hypothetical protein IJV48_00405 [Ruminococcus sp.]|nr:hypothetical protein [Ruminococcus sp.]